MTSTFTRSHKSKDGTVTYSVLIKEKVGGAWKQRTIATGLTSQRDADSFARQAKRAAQERRAGISTVTPSVADAVTDYLASLKALKKPGYDSAERFARLHILPTLGHVLLGDMERHHVQALAKAKEQEGLAPQSLRHIVGTLRTAITHAIDSGTFKGANVAHGVKLPRMTKAVRDTLEPDEVVAVLGEIPPKLRPMVATSFFTGLRPGELAFLRPQDVDVDGRVIFVRGSHDRDRTKTGSERVVPIADELVPWIGEALKHAAGGKVFPVERGGRKLRERKGTEMIRAAMVRAAASGAAPDLVTGWTLKCRRRGCGYREERETFAGEARCPVCGMILWPVGHARPVRFYDLRHSTATLMVDAGVVPAAVSAILGHADVNFTLRTYVHLQPRHLIEAVNRISTKANARDNLGVKVVQARKEKS